MWTLLRPLDKCEELSWACLSVRLLLTYLRNQIAELHHILAHVDCLAVARSYSDGIVTRSVLPIYWMTSSHFYNAHPSSSTVTARWSMHCIITLFSPLGKLAGRAIYFACVNFFFFSLFFYYEQSYLSIYWTDFHDLFTKWKVFAWIFVIRSSISNSSRDVAMATN